MRRNLAWAALIAAAFGTFLFEPASVRAHFGDASFLDLPYMQGFADTTAADPLAARLTYVVSRAASLTNAAGQTALPPSTTFDGYTLGADQIVTIRITVPQGAFDTLSEIQVATIDHIVGLPVMGDGSYGGNIIQLRIGSGEYKPLGSYLPPAPKPAPETSIAETGSATMILRQKLQAQGVPTQQALGGPSANADGQPTGALSGVVVFCSAGHGWTAGTSSWYLQRPLLLNMVEDYGNIDQLNLFAQYCYNAGAVVVPFRPVGYQNIEIVLDNDDPGVTYTGTWSNSSATIEYYENGTTTSGVPYRFATASSVSETATARYTPTIATAGFYPVYTWVRDGTDRVLQTYRIVHSGGTATMKIDHERVGKGWIWLGTYHFNAGTGGYAEISNLSPVAGVIIADAIRFGNGIGDIVRPGPGTISGYPRDEECSRYWAESELGNNAVGFSTSTWNTSGDDGSDNVGTAGRWSALMNRTDVNNDRWRRVYVEYHSNAAGCAGGPPCSAKGTVALVSASAPTTNQNAFATILGDKMEADMIAQNSLWEYNWGARANPYVAEFGAISTNANNNEFDATIIEVAFHDNPDDAANLRNLKVRDAVARSTVQGVIQFLNTLSGSQVPVAFAPDAPERVRATHDGAGNIVLSWTPATVGTATGHAATGYKIYRSSNGYGFGNAVVLGNVTTATLNDIPAGTTTYLRVSATNAGGESMPSETLAVRRGSSGASQILIVTGFDRVSRTLNPIQNIPSGPMERQIPRQINAFDYVVQHAAALTAAGRTFDSASNEAVISGTVSLANYAAVVWCLGRESSADKTFNATEQSLVTTYLNGGGRLFATGTDIGFDLVGAAGGASFYQNTLKGNYVGDNSSATSAIGIGGCLTGVASFSFSTANGAPYNATSPDRLLPQSGGTSILTYVGGTADGAGIQYDSGVYRVVMFGFPFECIASSTVRADVMTRVIDYLLYVAPVQNCPPGAITGFEGYLDGDQVMFRQPNFSSATIANLIARPNDAIVASDVAPPEGVKSYKLQWRFLDADPGRWLLLTTQNTGLIPNPTIDLRRAVRMKLRFEAPVPASLRVTLGVRETGTSADIGQDGGTGGTIEWVGATSVSGGVPQGQLITAQPGVWQTITFLPNPSVIQPYTGDGVLSAANNKGVLEHLAFAAVDHAGQFTIYLDQIEQPCPAKADFDQDGDVDITDFAHFQVCLSGASIPQNLPACADARLDADNDVDADDYAKFENCLTGSDIVADPDCAQ